jgi:hypothetical protein
MNYHKKNPVTDRSFFMIDNDQSSCKLSFTASMVASRSW